MHSKIRTLAIAMVVMLLGLAGCESFVPFQTPMDLMKIRVHRVDSAQVRVPKAWLCRERGQICAMGYVARSRRGVDTTDSHVHITIADQSGRILRELTGRFWPAEIPRLGRRHHLPYSRFQIVLEPFPAEAHTVEIRASDNPAEE